MRWQHVWSASPAKCGMQTPLRTKGLNEGQWDRQGKSKPSESRSEHEMQACEPQEEGVVMCSLLASTELWERSWRLYIKKKRRLLDSLNFFIFERIIFAQPSYLTHLGCPVRENLIKVCYYIRFFFFFLRSVWKENGKNKSVKQNDLKIQITFTVVSLNHCTSISKTIIFVYVFFNVTYWV